MIEKMMPFLLLLMTTMLQAQDTLVDDRDGKTYNTVRIGNQVWMSENLRFAPEISHVDIYVVDAAHWSLAGKKPADCYFCPMDSLKYCARYGVLYTWEAAQSACPAGWHLPSHQEFNFLLSNIGGNDKEVFIAFSETGSTGFNAQLGGALFYYNSNAPHFGSFGHSGFYWTSTNYGKRENASTYFVFSSRLRRIFHHKERSRTAFSVRCVKNGAVK